MPATALPLFLEQGGPGGGGDVVQTSADDRATLAEEQTPTPRR